MQDDESKGENLQVQQEDNLEHKIII